MSARLRPVAIGAHVEAYPLSAWSRLPAGVNLDDLWKIVGPQVDRHINNLPLWKVCALVYFEGLAHGQAAEQRRALAATQPDGGQP